MNRVLLIKLAEGTEIVGELIEDAKTTITISRPLQIHYRYFVGGTPSVSFSRYMMFTSEPIVVIDTRHVISLALARAAFAEYYGNCVEDYFGKVEDLVDQELRSAISTEKEDRLKKMLEMMSVDNATVN